MSRLINRVEVGTVSFPRASGDEPGTGYLVPVLGLFSPRERG